MTELLPCPFCGNTPTLVRNDDHGIVNIACGEGTCKGSKLIVCFAKEDEEEAVESWNTRKRPNQRVGRFEDLSPEEAEMLIQALDDFIKK